MLSAVRRGLMISMALLALAACKRADDWGVAGLERPRNLIFDGDSAYFIDRAVDKDELGVFRAPLAGGLARAIVLDEKSIDGLVVLGPDVCWNATARRQIRCAPKQGGALPRVAVSAEQTLESGLASDGRELFYALRDGPLLAVLPRQAAPRVVSKLSGRVLAVAGERVWFSTSKHLYSVPIQGGDATAVAAIDMPIGVVPVGSRLYLLTRSADLRSSDGSLLRISLDGKPPQLLATLIRPSCLAADETHVWVCADASQSTEGDQSRLGVYDETSGKLRLEKRDPYFSAGAFHAGKFYFLGHQGNHGGGVLRRRRP